MHDETTAAAVASLEAEPEPEAEPLDVVSTHVLVPEHQLARLRDLSKRTRVHQSEYLREAVDDLLAKYGRLEAAKEEG